jgi:hypothetical protein
MHRYHRRSRAYPHPSTLHGSNRVACAGARSACASYRGRGLPVLTPLLLAAVLMLVGGCSSAKPASPPRAAESSVTTNRVPATAAQVATQAPGSPATAAAATKVASSATSAPPTQSGGQPAARRIDPCSLVTQQEAEAGAGKPLGPGQSRSRGDLSRGGTAICQYNTADGKSWVEVDVLQGTSARSSYDLEQESVGKGATREVPGLGDRAFITDSQGIMFVLKGDLLLSFTIVPLVASSADMQVRLTNFAQLALSRV